MTYAFLIDGLDPDAREKIDIALTGGGIDKKAQAKRERAAMASIMNIPGVAR